MGIRKTRKRVVSRLSLIMKKVTLNFITGICLLVLTFSCTIEDNGTDPLQNLNAVIVGTEVLEFRSAKLSITGPANITGVNSHVRAKLELSSAQAFQEPFAENTDVMSITLMSVNNGFDLPKFPLASGIYDVFPPTGFSDPGIIGTLEGTSFCYGPAIGLGYKPSQTSFGTVHESFSGTIQVIFDVKNSLLKINYDYLTKEGVRVSGSNTLPLNLSSFNP